MLTKNVEYAYGGTVSLFRFSSYVTMPDSARNGGSYYQPIDTGYEVSTYVFRPAADVTSDYAIRRTDSGLMSFYQPTGDKTIAQYRIRRDGKLLGPVYWTNDDGKWTKDGWQVSFGSAFLGTGRVSVEMESKLALLRGDPRALHRRILSEPEYAAWAKDAAPRWLADVQLDGMESLYSRYQDTNDWWVHGMLPLELPFVNEGQYVIFILQDWSNVGFYPFEGEVRYRVGGEVPYGGVTTPERVREVVETLHARSPKVRVALYTNPASIGSTYPGQWEGDIKDVHPDWIMYNKDGGPQKGEPGCYRTNLKNREYRGVLLDQFAHIADYYGADFFYLDYGGLDDINWGPTSRDRDNDVVTQADCVDFLKELAALSRRKGVALWNNGLCTSSLVSDLGIFELSAPYWMPAYERDWRVFAGGAYLAKLYREARPTARNEVMYPGYVPYYNMIAGYGLLGMGVNQTRGFSQVTARLTFERLGNALRNTTATEARVRPDWWRLETRDLETAVLKQADAHVLPVIWHGSGTTTTDLSVSAADMKVNKGNCLFALGSHVTMPLYRDVHQVPGREEECVSIDGFQTIAEPPDTLNFSIELVKDELHHLVLTQVPGFVYSMNGEREYLLLPDNNMVRITGELRKNASSYRVRVTSRVSQAEALLYIPVSWGDVAVRGNGKDVPYQAMQWGNDRFALVSVRKGPQTISLANRVGTWRPAGSIARLTNPTMDCWKVVTDFFPTVAGVAEHKVYTTDGRNCLAIHGASGSFMLTTHTLHGMPPLNPEGIEFWLYGRGERDSVEVTIGSNQWHYSIDASFRGWKRFSLSRKDFTPEGTWSQVEYVTFGYTNGGLTSGEPEGVVFADIRFLPAEQQQDRAEATPQVDTSLPGSFRTWSYIPK